MGCCITISQSNIGIIETCGKYDGLAPPGCQFILPWSSVVCELSTRLQEYTCTVETKTKDNVFVNLALVVQFQVIPERVQDAYYKVLDPRQAMSSLIFNSIRAKVPTYLLEALYVERGTISQQLKNEVDRVMESYGFEIVSALISDIDPGNEITNAMDTIQRLQRLRVAAVDEAESKKLTRVRRAEAQCDARRLSGEGIAEQRKAIMKGLMESVEQVRTDVPSLSNDDATNLLLINQYYDTLRDMAAKSKETLLVQETSGGMEKIASQLKVGVTQMMR